MKKYLITVIGPTAIGKTTLAIRLANYFKTEIISSDSRQFYKEMNIGTAVPTPSELAQVRHHFIQNRSIFEDYSVGQFERDALERLDLLFKNHEFAVLVGGSGLYVDAVLKGLDNFPDIDVTVRKELKKQLKDKGLTLLQDQLKMLDRESWEKMDLNNPQRLIRALEICLGTGKPYSSYLTDRQSKRYFIPIKIGIQADRKIVYERIEKRVDSMMKEGLLDEAKSLYPHKELNALQTVGYKELFNYLDGVWDLDFAIAEIKKNTRRFAKRQGTWFRKDEGIRWFDYQEDINKIIQYINAKIKS